MSLVLRQYQKESVEEAFQFLRNTNLNGVLELPTGAGKTAVASTITSRVVERGGRILIVAHVKELLEQSFATTCAMLPELHKDNRIGLYSAGLNSRDTEHDVLVCGVQSVYKRANKLGRRDLILVDEAQLIPPSGDGMYQTLIKDCEIVNPKCRLLGLTATPYRLTSGLIYGNEQPFQELIHRVDMKPLIADGYLSPLVGCAGATPNVEGLHKRGGEYIEKELDRAFNDESVVDRAIDDLMQKAADRHHWIVFCVNKEHAKTVCQKLCARGVVSKVIDADTPKDDRKQWIEDYKKGKIRALVNINVLSIGFDAPMIDCVALMRKTGSPGMYYQWLGRGFRIHETKKDCLVLDFGGNIREHGPVDSIRPPRARVARESSGEKKEKEKPKGKCCPECGVILEYSDSVCTQCGYEYPANHESMADTGANPLSQTVLEDWDIIGAQASTWKKSGVPESERHKFPDTLMVEWYSSQGSIREWICVGHGNVSAYARKKAVEWWSKIMPNIECPDNAKEAAEVFFKHQRYGSMLMPEKMQVISGGKYPELKKLYYIEVSRSCKSCVHYSDGSGYCKKFEDKVPTFNIPVGCENHEEVPF